MVDSWTQDRIDKATTLFRAGVSASRIAAQLGGGATRNSVLGKLYRMGALSRGPAPIAREKPERVEEPKPARQKPSMPAVPKPSDERKAAQPILGPAPLVSKGKHIVVATLEPHMCRWPHGDPGHKDFHFCGAPKSDTSSYCEFHAKQAYAPTQAGRNLKKATTERNVGRAIRRGA